MAGKDYRIPVKEPGYWDFFTSEPGVPGTDLIMRVYEALERRRIPFYFSYYLGDALATVGLKESIRVHFYLPQQNVAIIVQGGYWFDQVKNLNNTALQLALIEYCGIKPVWWTEPEIMLKGLDELFRETPELNMPYIPGDPLVTDYAPLDYRSFGSPPPRGPRKERATRERGRRERQKTW